MTAYDLPTTLEVGGKEYAIRTDYRAVLDIIMAQGDPELSAYEKAIIMLRILYEEPDSIPRGCLEEALKKAVWFIDCGQEDSGETRKKPKLMDWEQDAQLIITAINAQIKGEVRSMSYMHWWTFFGYYMSIGESLFSTVVGIRSKRTSGKKLDKSEQEFLRDNKSLVIIKKRVSDEDKQKVRDEKSQILDFLNGRR